MASRGLKSNYTKAKFRNHTVSVNHSLIGNQLNRAFSNRKPLEAIITDLTYVRVGAKWHYVCFIIDLFNREIIGHSCGPNKDAQLVKRAFQRIGYPLTKVQIFRGKGFDNQTTEEILTAFEIERSLSKKGFPYDNTIAESTYKSFKIEFVYPRKFETLAKLELPVFDYVNWWNHLQIHRSLGYETPAGYRKLRLAQLPLDNDPRCVSAG